MKQFKSFLAQKMEEHMARRQVLGYSDSAARSHLLMFDNFLCEKNVHWQTLNPDLFLELRNRYKKEPATANTIISVVRTFFNFLVRQGIYETNPLKDIPRIPKRAFVPYVFTPEQVEQLLAAISRRLRKSKRFYLTDLGLHAAMVLIAHCGLRISEPLRLKYNHYRKDEGTIYIAKTKFKKDRLIPVPQVALRTLDNYLAVRLSIVDHDSNSYLFMGENKKCFSQSTMNAFFHPAVKDIGIEHIRKTIGDVTFGPPTVHCLRHSFAINSLMAIRDRGEDVQRALPVLAAYMGHRKYQYTSTYLKVLDGNMRQGLIDFARSQERK